MPQDLPVIRLQPGREKRVLTGYPWAFSNEIRMDAGLREVPLGGLVRLEAANGRPIGIAGFNRHALIAARLLSYDAAMPIDAGFLVERLHSALALRERLYDRPYYRLVHAEADGLPGLIVDRYGEILVVQENAAVMDRLNAPLLEALDAVLQPRIVVLRNDSPARALEGLEREVRVAKGTLDGPVELEENGARFVADPAGGQKTGWFFDQRDNRAFVARLAAGRTAIDFYTHTGGFCIQMALAGASHVTAVDRSAPALEAAAAAAALNGVAGRIAFRKADAFDEMQRLRDRDERFGVVVVDPPAFVKSRKDLKAGAQGYRKMTRLAARIVEPGGVLLAASCSHHVDPALFAEQVARGLTDAGRQGRILRASGAGPDHPVHPLLPESAYLKALVLQLD
ncbi:MAG TPA: class I SAM-dependent rRNA methyltransferase [Alphaproteobacteria bacterium]|nr:class I SAM-dependent rRNA methyltransferase [Alphaproteobacteria bacterium]